ncbi:surfeit locus protein 6 [Mantella aurantiaca]
MAMASLASKDSYLQSLGRKVCAQESTENRKRKLVPHVDGTEKGTAGKKKKRNKKPRHLRHDGMQRPPPKMSNPVFPKSQRKDASLSSFSTVNMLKRRLHEKIEESRGQSSNKSLSEEEIEKRRQRRKHERDRKKRKRKELKLQTSSQETPEVSREEQTVEEGVEETPQVPLVFNKVEVHEEPLNKILQKKEKKERVKGNITPMTGKNYKQLLSRLEAQKGKLEELRAKDQEKAKEYESKIKWTNVLYKAEGLKIKDDEGMLKTALKRKEKQREQRKKRWDNRTLQTTEKMQKRQDKRTRNIKKKKMAKIEKKKNRARKKGRVMPEDLAKANIK